MKKDNLCETILSLIRDYLKTLKLNNQILSELYLEFPSQKEHGDLSISLALRLSKVLKKPPQTIADSIVYYLDNKIKYFNLNEYINSVKVAGPGFINFFLTDRIHHEEIVNFHENVQESFSSN